MLVLDHLLISNGPNDGQVCGGLFEPADPNDKASVAKLSLMTPAGAIELEDEAALLLFEHYRMNGQTIQGSQTHIMISREAVHKLKEFFITAEGPPKYVLPFAECKRIVETLAARL